MQQRKGKVVASEYDKELAATISDFYADPLGHVLFSYPWDTNAGIQLVKFPDKYRSIYPGAPEYGPDEWACEFLTDLGNEVAARGFDGRKAVMPIRMATVSGHGIGKSVIVAWAIKWIMDTRPMAKGVVTANTAEQLKTKTWAEVGKWHLMSMTRDWFRYSSGKGAMSLVHVQYPQSWRCDAQTSREENSEAFAGLHAASSTPFYVFDEASAIPSKIAEVREGGTTDGEPILLDFGNPTRNSGFFYEQCEGKLKHLWKVRKIDSRSVAITNKERIAEWVKTWGEDSDFVRVRVRGEFPKAGSAQFIPTSDVVEARNRKMTQEMYVANQRTAALVLGVDVARFGDDMSVIYPRHGDDARSWAPRVYRGLRTTQLVAKVAAYVQEFRTLGMEVAAIFVDGGGVGGGVVDQLLALGYPVFEVQFGGRPDAVNDFRFRVDEIWDRMREHISTRLMLPVENSGEIGDLLQSELTAREYGFTLKLQKSLESKEDMKERGVGSPDIADALALTYAQTVAPKELSRDANVSQPVAVADYDPLNSGW